ncbi:TerB family tellurite resistance protein [Vannielia litorea]|uniref:tellurite resistance TerB family protein n=1 Tax=Vannielia litorea TaxID=1217970 RepID=UPI001BD12C19|nr:TerB family tellurite resistance protein [Vannielia litorea]MBS8226923.1 TerB family tellurite resistance protein [Vannielia litorea]
MQKLGVAAAVALVALSATAHEAEARRGGGAVMVSEQLHFVAPTRVGNGSGGQMALCHLTKKHHFFGIGLWREMESYALSYEMCTGAQYVPLSSERMARLVAAGEVPADLPVEPRMQVAQLVSGFAGSAAIGATLGLFGLTSLLAAGRRRKRRKAMTGANSFAQRVLDVMCHAAKADGVVDPEEVKLIAFASEKLTGTAYSAAQIERLIGMAATKVTDAEFKAFGTGLDAHQRETLMRGALMVTVSDGTISQSEKGFLARLAASLQISGIEMQGMLRSL